MGFRPAILRSVKLRRIASISAGFAIILIQTGAHATGTLLHDYELGSSYSDVLGTGTPLQSDGGSITSGAYTWSLANQGLALSKPFADPTSYSLEAKFEFNTVAGWRKIFDFKNRTTDQGLYDENGSTYFVPGEVSTTADFVAHQFSDVILTRDGNTNLTTVYVNGHQTTQFIDSSNLAVVSSSNVLHFFEDDTTSADREASDGSADYIRIYSGALNTSQIASLAAPAPVPEPAFYQMGALLGLGALGLIKRRFHK